MDDKDLRSTPSIIPARDIIVVLTAVVGMVALEGNALLLVPVIAMGAATAITVSAPGTAASVASIVAATVTTFGFGIIASASVGWLYLPVVALGVAALALGRDGARRHVNAR